MNLRKKLLTFLWTKPSSAKWLTEVENIDNNYSQADNLVPYIDTGVESSWDEPFEMVATVTKTSANRCLVLGNAPNQKTFYVELTATNRLRFGSQDSTGTDPTFVEFNIYTNTNYPIPLNVPTKIWVKYNPRHDSAHTIDYEIGLEALDGSIKRTETGSVYRAGQPLSTRLNLRMFNDYRTPVSTFDGGFKIHQCEIKAGNQYRKYIACKDFNGVPCMYEKSTGTLAYNAGTGGFTAGRTITEVDWMHLTGTQYFKTGLKPNTLTTTLKTKYTFEGTAMMMGCRTSATYPEMCSIYMPTGSSSHPYSRIRLDWMTGDTSIFSSYLESEVVELEITGNYAKVNGVEYTDTTKVSFDEPAPFHIGACFTSSNSAYNYPMTGKMYFTHLYDPNKGERYCVPAHDENNIGFFFDRINHFIMDNLGTNTEDLTWGDDIHYVGYLESTGPQWIDTGIKMQGKYGVEIEAKQTSATTGAGRYLFGDAPASAGRYLIVVTSGGNQYRLSLDVLNKDSGVSGYDGKYHVHKVENKTYFVDGGSKGSLAATDFTCNRNARLFSVATSSTLLDNTWQIKQGKQFDENGNALTHFVPCIKGNNKPAMFDLVSRTFFTNQATGDDFVCGSDIIGSPIREQFIPLQYLTGEAGPYIDTGIKLGSDYGVEVVARQTNETTGRARYLFGDASTTDRYMLAVASSTDNYLFDLETASRYRLNTSFSGYDGQFHTHKIENKTYYIDGVSQGTSTSTGTFTTSQNAVLFCAAGASRSNSYWDIKSEKIFDGNGVLIQHLVPALRTVDGVAGMLDLVTGQFFTNAGTGEFDYAY